MGNKLLPTNYHYLFVQAKRSKLTRKERAKFYLACAKRIDKGIRTKLSRHGLTNADVPEAWVYGHGLDMTNKELVIAFLFCREWCKFPNSPYPC